MKSLIGYVLLAIVVGSLVGFAVYDYQTRPQSKPAVTYSQGQYKAVVDTMLTHDAVNKVKADQLTAKIQDDQARLTSVCASLKNLKLNNSNCPQ